MTSTRCGYEPRVVSSAAGLAAAPAPTPSARPALPAMLHGERAAFEHRLSRSVGRSLLELPCGSARCTAGAARASSVRVPALRRQTRPPRGGAVRRERPPNSFGLPSLSLRIGRASASDSETMRSVMARP
jgi:hypothetical protein